MADWIKIADYAKITGKDRTTVFRYVRDGILPGKKINGKWYAQDPGKEEKEDRPEPRIQSRGERISSIDADRIWREQRAKNMALKNAEMEKKLVDKEKLINDITETLRSLFSRQKQQLDIWCDRINVSPVDRKNIFLEHAQLVAGFVSEVRGVES